MTARAVYDSNRGGSTRGTGAMNSFDSAFVHTDCLVHVYEDPETGHDWNLTGRQSNFSEFHLDDEGVGRAWEPLGWTCR